MTQVATNDLANTATSAVSSVPTIRDADATFNCTTSTASTVHSDELAGTATTRIEYDDSKPRDLAYDTKALDRRRLLRLNLHNRASGQKELGPADEQVDTGAERELTRPGVFDWEIAPKPELASMGQIWVATADTRGTKKYPAEMTVQPGDILLEKNCDYGEFGRWAFLIDEYADQSKFPHISEECRVKFAKKDYKYVRKLGLDERYRTSITNVPFKGVGSAPTYLQDEGGAVGCVPKSVLRNVRPEDVVIPPKDARIRLEARYGPLPRFTNP